MRMGNKIMIFIEINFLKLTKLEWFTRNLEKMSLRGNVKINTFEKLSAKSLVGAVFML